jgi:hypothetical protein
MKFAASRKSVRFTPSECRNAAASRRSFSTPDSFMTTVAVPSLEVEV